MKLKSKPHEIEAFQYKGYRDTKFPKWWIDASIAGKTSITDNASDCYIAVRAKRGTTYAEKGDWVCLNSKGTMFILSDEEVKEDFYEGDTDSADVDHSTSKPCT